MRLTRIHIPGPLAAGTQVELPAQAGAHVARVLRLEAGAPLTLFDGLGGEYAATLLPANGRLVMARVTSHASVERESPLAVTLLQGIARGERMDLIVQKATELGVARIVPVLAERSIVKVDTKQRERKREHWQAIAISACEQCGRNRVPEVCEPVAFADSLQGSPAGSLRCLLAADGDRALTEAAAQGSRQPIVLLIGPEGGLSENERGFARDAGFIACRMGPRIMRTETAGLAALAALQAIAGDFAS